MERTDWQLYSTPLQASEAAQQEANRTGVIQYVHRKRDGWFVSPVHPDTPEDLTRAYVPDIKSGGVKYESTGGTK